MTRRPGWRGEKRWSRADAEKPDDTKTPEVAAGPKKCHGALAPLPNRGRQWRAQRSCASPLHAGLAVRVDAAKALACGRNRGHAT